MPTHEGLTVVIVARPIAEFDDYRRDVEGSYFKAFELAPAFAERIRGARREARFVGMRMSGYFRKPFGTGWALVGDAGCNKDFITGMGILDAFRDAELCASALEQTFSGRRSYDDALLAYQRTRDEKVLPMYEFTYQIAPLEPAPPDFQKLLAAAHGNPSAMSGFVQVNAGVLSPAEYFSEENVQRILAQ
jgi:flavin-dependent dehydrogenase